ncbi:MAG: hypothetical protein LBC81_05645 [Tannerellaceae bacterium]|jgi:hypothetical protein|nr:hypothetical protein [Tannerellaceae bacterium]
MLTNMRIKKNILCCIILTAFVFPALAQEYVAPFSQYSVALKTSTMGYGLEVASPVNDKFVLRAGLNLTAGFQSEYMNIALPDETNELYDAFGYVPDYRAKLGMNFVNGNILVDYHPAGIFHITAGLYLGQSNFGLQGFLADWGNYNEPAVLKPGYSWPTVDLGDQELVLTDGRANLDLQLGGIVKPYFGIGVGRAISKNNKLSVKFEIGAIYLGPYSLKQDNRKINLASSTDSNVKDVHNVLKQIIAYPILNLQLSWRFL